MANFPSPPCAAVAPGKWWGWGAAPWPPWPGARLCGQVQSCPGSASKGIFCISVPLMKKGERSVNEIC